MNKFKVLDHGYIHILNVASMAELGELDRAPAQAARLSFGGGPAEEGRTLVSDMKLAEYLMKNKHTSPFEMVEVWIEMKMPIFVARQFVRHRTISLNEISARYVELPEEWYIPRPEHVGAKAPSAKQGRDLVAYTENDGERARNFCDALNLHCRGAYQAYKHHLNEGVPPELARCFLHVNHYTRWLWKQDLHNLMHFLALREDGHAQFEAQEYARAIRASLGERLPHTMALYDQYRKFS